MEAINCIIASAWCITYTWLNTEEVVGVVCFLPGRCITKLKDCYDHCTAEVGVENDANSVQVAGAAPADIAMS